MLLKVFIMIKRLFIFIFYLAAIAFCIFAALSHMELYQAIIHSDFSSGDAIKASIGNIVLGLGDLIIFLIVIFTFFGFLIHIGNTRKGGKKMIKCVESVGAYFVIFMVVTLIGSIIMYIGNSGFFEFVKESVTKQEFYLPLLLNIIAGIFFLVAKLIKRGGPVSGSFVVVGVALLFFINIKYFNATRADLNTNLRFVLLLVTCGLAVIPSFIPDLGIVGEE